MLHSRWLFSIYILLPFTLLSAPFTSDQWILAVRLDTFFIFGCQTLDLVLILVLDDLLLFKALNSGVKVILDLLFIALLFYILKVFLNGQLFFQLPFHLSFFLILFFHSFIMRLLGLEDFVHLSRFRRPFRLRPYGRQAIKESALFLLLLVFL